MFKNRGGKMLTWHGLADELIMAQGTVSYYNSVVAKIGGLSDVQASIGAIWCQAPAMAIRTERPTRQRKFLASRRPSSTTR